MITAALQTGDDICTTALLINARSTASEYDAGLGDTGWGKSRRIRWSLCVTPLTEPHTHGSRGEVVFIRTYSLTIFQATAPATQCREALLVQLPSIVFASFGLYGEFATPTSASARQLNHYEDNLAN